MNTKKIIRDARALSDALDKITYSGKVITVYNPLQYAWKPFEKYLHKYGAPPKKAIFLGMNPGPWGMAQTGIPFGEINAVRDWIGIEEEVLRPSNEIPNRPVTGFECSRSEVSGRRVWGLMRERFGSPDNFFQDYFIENYCPLIFFDAAGKNLTPDKLLKSDREKLYRLCNQRLVSLFKVLKPKYVIGFGKFAAERLEEIVHGIGGGSDGPDTGKPAVIHLLHPSPANPAANRGWAEAAAAALKDAGVW